MSSKIRVNKVVERIIYIEEGTCLTGRIVGSNLSVIPYIERRILEVRLLVSGTQLTPCIARLKVIQHEGCMDEYNFLEVKHELELVTIS